jgi:hypothetical protein
LDDELIEQLRIVALEALGNDSVLVVGLIERGEGSYSHIILKDARSLSKDAPNDHISEFTGQGHAAPKPGRRLQEYRNQRLKPIGCTRV